MYIENKTINKIPSNIVSKRVEDKTFTLQFLPECLNAFESKLKIIFSSLSLSTQPEILLAMFSSYSSLFCSLSGMNGSPRLSSNSDTLR